MPLHLLEKFERENDFSCTRFVHAKSFSGHSNTPLDILDYGVELPLMFKLQSGAEQPVFLPFFVERTNFFHRDFGYNGNEEN